MNMHRGPELRPNVDLERGVVTFSAGVATSEGMYGFDESTPYEVGKSYAVARPATGTFIVANNPSGLLSSSITAAAKFAEYTNTTPPITEDDIHALIDRLDLGLDLAAMRERSFSDRTTSHSQIRLAGVVRLGDSNRYALITSGEASVFRVTPEGTYNTPEISNNSPYAPLKHLAEYSVTTAEIPEGGTFIVTSNRSLTETILNDEHPNILPDEIGGHNPANLNTNRQESYTTLGKALTLTVNIPGEASHQNNLPSDQAQASSEVAKLLDAMGDTRGKLLDHRTPRTRRSFRELAGRTIASANTLLFSGINYLSEHRKGATISALGVAAVGLVAARFGMDFDIPYIPDNLQDFHETNTELPKFVDSITPDVTFDHVDEAWDIAWAKVFGQDITVTTDPTTTTIDVPNLTTGPLEQWDGQTLKTVNSTPNPDVTGFQNGTVYHKTGQAIHQYLLESPDLLDHTVNLRDNPNFEESYRTLIDATLKQSCMTWEEAAVAQPGTTFTVPGEALRNFMTDNGYNLTVEKPGGTETRHEGGNIWLQYGGAALAGITIGGPIGLLARRLTKNRRA